MINIVVLLLLGIGLFYLYAKYKQTYWSRRGVYSPPSHWLFGHFRDAVLMKTAVPNVLGELHRQTEGRPYVGIYILQKPFLLVRHPDIIKQILVKDFNCFSDRYFASKRKSDTVGSTGLFSIDNPQWKYLRMKLSPAFSSGKQKRLFNLMLERADNMKNYLSEKILNDGKISLETRDICSKYTTDVITSLSFGIETNSFKEPEFYTHSNSIFNVAFIRVIQLFLNFFFPQLNDIFGGSMLAEKTDYFRKIFWDSMNNREKSGVKRGDVIDLLVELKNEKQSPEFTFAGDQLLAQSAIFFVAGRETSAITMTFSLFEIAKHPDIQEKIRKELRDKMGKNDLSYELISEMTYLQQVVSETLRLYPPASIIDRVATEDYKIPGTDTVIEKGTVVYVTLKGLHEDPEYHPDPFTFDPERFSETKKQNMKSCTYMPFGDGPRVCIGMRTGMLQSMIGLITILREYHVSVNTDYKNDISKRAIFLAPSNGIHLYFKRSPLIN